MRVADVVTTEPFGGNRHVMTAAAVVFSFGDLDKKLSSPLTFSASLSSKHKAALRCLFASLATILTKSWLTHARLKQFTRLCRASTRSSTSCSTKRSTRCSPACQCGALSCLCRASRQKKPDEPVVTACRRNNWLLVEVRIRMRHPPGTTRRSCAPSLSARHPLVL